MDKRIYIICPVRGVTEEQAKEIMKYVETLENNGDVCHFPPRDVKQDSDTGIDICQRHLEAMECCEEVHIFWDASSKGSHFDLGMAFAMGLPWKLIRNYTEDTEGKSYLKVIKGLEKK